MEVEKSEEKVVNRKRKISKGIVCECIYIQKKNNELGNRFKVVSLACCQVRAGVCKWLKIRFLY